MTNTRTSKVSDVSKHPTCVSSSGNDIADAGSMDKIRDILFGNQARDYENRFSKMEQQLTRDAAELKEELLKRIDALETYIKQEMSDINDRIKNESNERTDAHKLVQREIKDGLESLNKKLVHNEENLTKKSTALREQILEQSKALSTEILSKYDQTANNLKQASRQLDEAKVNRSDLSGFFLDIAMRLSGEDSVGPSSD
ncbi:MAG: hypothetical protein ABIJ31_11670 [Pseudomonadota bacterium]